jgi:hypothetical protein
MKKQTNWQRIGSVVLTTIAILFTAHIQASAQKKDYKPGEKIEYKSSGYPEVWEEATFVRATPDGSQPIIREKPNEFHKDGFQRGTSWANIRPLGVIKTTREKEPKTEEPENTQETTETTNGLGSGLMTQADVLSFLQIKLGDKPFANPRREELKTELAEMIKQRGLNFRYSEVSQDYSSKLAKYGANTSETVFPLRDNYGEPTKQAWLMGAWNLGKVGAAVDYVRNNRVYRQGEIGVANVGTLTLKADGSYSWKAGTKDSTSGKWRKATKTEMKSQGGDGIVLLKAKNGYDWIVTKNRNTTLKGEWLFISELGTRQINEYGSRSGKR